MEYKDFAIDIARQAGEIIRQNFTIGMKREWKEDNSPVTETDLTINSLLIDLVKKNFPDHGVRGEEESYNLESKKLWVCDPLDGTIPFTLGVPVSTFSLALVDDGVPILGVVYDPYIDRMFCAEKGRGVYLNDSKIGVTDSSDLVNAGAAFEAWKMAKYQLWGLDKILEDRGLKTVKFASIVYPTVLVAAGEFIAAVFPGKTAHDAAAIKIIVEEAGGKVTDIFGDEQRYDQEINGFIATNGKVHDEIVEIVGRILKENNND